MLADEGLLMTGWSIPSIATPSPRASRTCVTSIAVSNSDAAGGTVMISSVVVDFPTRRSEKS